VAFFADSGAGPSSGVVAVREYGSSSAPRPRLLSTKTATLLGRGLAGRLRRPGGAARANQRGSSAGGAA